MEDTASPAFKWLYHDDTIKTARNEIAGVATMVDQVGKSKRTRMFGPQHGGMIVEIVVWRITKGGKNILEVEPLRIGLQRLKSPGSLFGENHVAPVRPVKRNTQHALGFSQ